MTATLSSAEESTARVVQPAVEVRGVTQRYRKGPVVLADVDLTVAPGEFVCLVGASGSGKTTLLQLLAGLEKTTSGSVLVAGEPPRAGSGQAALVFQEHALFPWLTAAGNVELALALSGVPKAERRARAETLLATVRLHASADARVHELSGGMRQRVAIARALAQDASVLLMDEPFAALDAITRDALHDELTRVHAETGIAVVFVTHNVREAVRLGQRVVLLGSRPGRVIAEWPVTLAQPRRIESPEVAVLAAEITDRLHVEMARDAASLGRQGDH